ERGEVVEIVLDLRAVGDLEADRAEQPLHALERARRRVQSAATEAASGQRHVERLLGEARIELRARDRLAPLGERPLYPVFGGVDARPGLAARLRLELAEALQRLGEDPALAEVARLDALELGGVGRGTELRDRFGNDWVEVGHRGQFPLLFRGGVARSAGVVAETRALYQPPRRLSAAPLLGRRGFLFFVSRASPSPGSRAARTRPCRRPRGRRGPCGRRRSRPSSGRS